MAIVLYGGIVAALLIGAPVLEVRAGELRAGRAHIDVDDLGEPVALDGDAARAALRAGWDPADHHVISPWTRAVVRVAVTDEQDPTPAWVVSTRRPRELAAAITAAQRSR